MVVLGEKVGSGGSRARADARLRARTGATSSWALDAPLIAVAVLAVALILLASGAAFGQEGATLTAKLAGAVEGNEEGVGIGIISLALLLWQRFRSSGLLSAVMTGVEWARHRAVGTLPLSGLGLTAEQQEAVRARVGAWLKDALAGRISQAASDKGLEKALNKEVKNVTEPLKKAWREEDERAGSTSGIISAPPKLSVLLLALTLILGAAPGCVNAEARRLSQRLEGNMARLRAASVPHPTYDAAGREAYGRLWSETEGASTDLVRALGGRSLADGPRPGDAAEKAPPSTGAGR